MRIHNCDIFYLDDGEKTVTLLVSSHFQGLGTTYCYWVPTPSPIYTVYPPPPFNLLLSATKPSMDMFNFGHLAAARIHRCRERKFAKYIVTTTYNFEFQYKSATTNYSNDKIHEQTQIINTMAYSTYFHFQ